MPIQNKINPPTYLLYKRQTMWKLQSFKFLEGIVYICINAYYISGNAISLIRLEEEQITVESNTKQVISK